MAKNLQHGYLAVAVEAAAEKNESEGVTITDLFMERSSSPRSFINSCGGEEIISPPTRPLPKPLHSISDEGLRTAPQVGTKNLTQAQ
jgi:hypothetical protein